MCNITQSKLCNNDNCDICLERSYKSNPMSKLWSPKNNISPRHVFKRSRRMIIFNCDKCNHEFSTKLCYDTGCQYCASKKLCDNDNCKVCLLHSFKSHEKSNYWSNKNTDDPRQVFKYSQKEYLFNCGNCNHEFSSTLHDFSNNKNSCPYCSNPPKKLCDDNQCKSCLQHSFKSHEKSKYWSNKNTDDPRYVFKQSSKKFYFDCNCGHTFDSPLTSIVSGRWCRYCSEPSNTMCDDLDCTICFRRSFKPHEKSQYWSKKNNIDPSRVLLKSGNKYYFDCSCGHTFDVSLDNVVKGGWCPYCSYPGKKLCDNNKCRSCYLRSFASHEKSKYWSKKNVEDPRYIFKGSNEKYIFCCNYCNNDFSIKLHHVVANVWCPCTVHKTETKLYEYLKDKYDIAKQVKFDWCMNIKHLPFDLCINKYKLIIEIDGPQHFSQIMTWTPPEETQANDKYKMKCANNNGYSVIRIYQPDVFSDKNNWKNNLLNAIKLYDQPTNIYIGEPYKGVYYE